jgi:hypothetical protein
LRFTVEDERRREKREAKLGGSVVECLLYAALERAGLAASEK